MRWMCAVGRYPAKRREPVEKTVSTFEADLSCVCFRAVLIVTFDECNVRWLMGMKQRLIGSASSVSSFLASCVV